MKFIVSGTNIDVTEALKERVTQKLGKLSKFFNDDTEVHATLKYEKNMKIIDVNIPFNGTSFRAQEKNDDMYASIDKVVDTLEAQIVKNKTKTERKTKGPREVVDGIGENEGEEVELVETKTYSLKPMTVEEAIMLMKDKSKRQFFVFHDMDTRKVNVVYKTANGEYGIMEPEA